MPAQTELPESRPLQGRHLPLVLTVLILMASLLATYTLWSNAKQAAMAQLQTEFDLRIQERTEDIAERMDTYSQVLRGVNAFVSGSTEIERREFSAYVKMLQLSKNYPGIQGIGISSVIPQKYINQHIASIRKEGFPDYTLKPSGIRDTYTAITHIEPFNIMNRRAFGYDMFSEPTRRAAMETARDSGESALSGKVILVQEAETDVQLGFLMYLPIYRKDMPSGTLEERRAHILGWVYAPFRIDDFMAGLGGERSKDLIVTIYDDASVLKEACLFNCSGAQPRQALFQKVTRINVANHRWTIETHSTPLFESRLNQENANLIAMAGTGISLMLATVVWLLASGRRRALALALNMTHELRASEFRWKYALEGAGEGVWDWNIQTGEVVYSKRWKEMLGYGENDISAHFSAWETLIHPDDKERLHAAIQDYIHGKIENYVNEHRLRCKDGSWKWVLTRGMVVIRGETNDPLRMIGTHADITQRKEFEARETERQQALEEAKSALQQAQRLEAVGKLTGGVAHDFNNVLQIIAGNLQLALFSIDEENPVHARLKSALDAVERGSKLSSQLLAFARRQPLHPQVVNIGKLVSNTDDMLRRALGESIEIKTTVASGLWNTLVDPNQLENVIVNLAINARDAMPTGGTLTIELANAILDEEYVHTKADVPPGQYVGLAVSDTGSGISPEIMEHIFEPFFTTKPEGEGTGLGLSMAYGFVKQSGGHIQVYSEVGHGTTVKIYLPRSYEAEEKIDLPSDMPVIGGSETILVVEDDTAVQSTVVAMLNELGYRVLKADDAQSALEIVNGGEKIDLLFTDVIMPGPLHSPELARQAKAKLPKLAVLFTSGYTQNAIMHGGRLDPGIHLLSKPYRREQLARKIRQLLSNYQDMNMPRPLGESKRAINS
jgi:PAS domain S-box-containing protein